MATFTLNSVGRAPGCFGKATAITNADILVVNSGARMIAPLRTSGFTASAIRCLGAIGVGLGKGLIVVPKGMDSSGTIILTGASTLCLGSANIERMQAGTLTGGTLGASGYNGA